ncbi:hypothetical protein [Sphingobacterium paludis]|uniref:hypothetical protein n=1 Tax=Sphingobacterium paludis TaxID=1476465 RepID=UPI00105D97BB|nr:hypothetical protein [Sphingobacterium paludis]
MKRRKWLRFRVGLIEGMLTGIKDSFLQEVKNTQLFRSFVVHQEGGAIVRRERQGLQGGSA